jgi:hypothetical protein
MNDSMTVVATTTLMAAGRWPDDGPSADVTKLLSSITHSGDSQIRLRG